MAYFYQVLSTFILSYVGLVLGIMFTWPSSTLMIFSSANTTLNRIMTEGELALLGSLSSVGALVSIPLVGFLLDRVGRKPCAIGSALTPVTAWAMISCSNQVEVVLTAVFISGLSSGIILINTVYVVEFCEENIRGSMTGCIIAFYNIGMLVSYVLGGNLEYQLMVLTNLSMAIVGVLGLFFLKESPLFLLTKGKEQEAAKSLGFYRRLKPNSKEVQNELEALKRVISTGSEECSPEEEKLNSGTKKEKLSMIQFIRKSRCTQRALLLCLTLMTASIFQGLAILQVYAEPLFAEAVPNISANVCSIILASVSVVFGLVAAYLTDRAGRRPLVIYGSLAAGFACVLLGFQIHMHWAPHWVTAVAIYFFAIAYILGPGTVPFILVGEVFLPEVKSFVAMLVIEWTFLSYSIILFIFNPLVALIGLGPVFYMFAVICFLTVAFSYYCQPETKGLTMDRIQDMFTPRKGRPIV
ncbi:hypothetical protein evm_003188 [Chilo suppressalis]|nr:hypothetical protein evm_003188 [Chilo suppressalis]